MVKDSDYLVVNGNPIPLFALFRKPTTPDSIFPFTAPFPNNGVIAIIAASFFFFLATLWDIKRLQRLFTLLWLYQASLSYLHIPFFF